MLYVLVCQVCLNNTPYGAHYYFIPHTRLSGPVISDCVFRHIINCLPFRQLSVLWSSRPLLVICQSGPHHMSLLQGDMGGERVLQKKWTTFLKAQLLCTLPDDGFPFNIIQDMFVLTPSPDDWKNTVFYGVFTSQW